MTSDNFAGLARHIEPLAAWLENAFSQPFSEPPLADAMREWHGCQQALIEDLIGEREYTAHGNSKFPAFDRQVLWRGRRVSIAIHRWPGNPESIDAQRSIDIHNHVGPAASVLLCGELLHRTYGSNRLAEVARAWLQRRPIEIGAPQHQAVLKIGDAYGLSADTFHHMMSTNDRAPASYTLFCTGHPIYTANFHINAENGTVCLHLARALADTLGSLRDDADFQKDPSNIDTLLSLLRGSPDLEALRDLAYLC